MTAHLGRNKLPAAGGLLSEIGEILTGAGRIELRLRDVACGIDMNAHADADDSPNRCEGFRGDIGQDLLENFTARR